VLRIEFVREQHVVKSLNAAAINEEIVVAAEKEASRKILLRYSGVEGEVEGCARGYCGAVDARHVGFKVQRVAIFG